MMRSLLNYMQPPLTKTVSELEIGNFSSESILTVSDSRDYLRNITIKSKDILKVMINSESILSDIGFHRQQIFKNKNMLKKEHIILRIHSEELFHSEDMLKKLSYVTLNKTITYKNTKQNMESCLTHLRDMVNTCMNILNTCNNIVNTCIMINDICSRNNNTIENYLTNKYYQQ